jgi:GH24 family phage-related lysozyme (muramidase)
MDDGRVEDLLLKDKENQKEDLYKWINEKKPADGKALYLTFPLPVRLAMLDMVYNLGLKRFKQFKKPHESVHKRRWAEAAGQCHRKKAFCFSQYVYEEAIRVRREAGT